MTFEVFPSKAAGYLTDRHAEEVWFHAVLSTPHGQFWRHFLRREKTKFLREFFKISQIKLKIRKSIVYSPWFP